MPMHFSFSSTLNQISKEWPKFFNQLFYPKLNLDTAPNKDMFYSGIYLSFIFAL